MLVMAPPTSLVASSSGAKLIIATQSICDRRAIPEACNGVKLGFYPEVFVGWLLQHLAAGRSLSDYMNIPDMLYQPTNRKYNQQPTLGFL